ncbi:DHA2 family efflux MFS transporter permease subunit [Streptomyces cinnamoneus]|uniref:MFS transporter n=1 Tax=Streptomyces cinnamoneus TaxID=53446 RepID=A0A918TXZ9_STRCJ|nr:DHA2 family efflux MFS transporter permease subunit [Streptomyces cinnamoneus]GHC68155.1 MFS transporter [Streptomyces cinnamoneus]
MTQTTLTRAGRPAPAAAPAGREAPGDARRWWGLAVLGLSQLIVLLDGTVVNIALPSAQADLGIGDGARQWVITSYALAFGGLLLLGGRIADLVGRKRTFLTGVAGFGLASAVGGAADGAGMLFAGRALQGAFAALIVPAAMSLLTTTFTDPRERGRAFGVFGAIAGAGAAAGLLIGGLVTQYLDWRWCMYIAVPVEVVVLIAAVPLLSDTGRRAGGRLDVPGAVLGTAGLAAIVYGLGEAESRGWGDPLVLGLPAGGVLLLAAFVLWQARTPHPLLPLRILRDRRRAGALLTAGLAPVAMFGVFLFMTYYLQVVLGYSAVRTGLAFLPLTLAMITGSTQLAARLVPFVAPRTIVVPGLLTAATGLLVLAQAGTGTPYATRVLPGLVLLGLGMGSTMMTVMATATAGVDPQDAGVTSAMVSTAQQVGGAVGTSVLNSVAAGATQGWLAGHPGAPVTEATVHGSSTALWWVAGLLVLTAVPAGILLRSGGPRQGAGRA